MKIPIFIGDLIMIRKKFAAVLAVLCLVLCAGIVFAPQASAVEETYSVSAQYKSSKYYDNFKSVTLSGDQAKDVIAIALSQLGYHEGDSNADLGGMNLNGTRDFVEYNVLYGKIDNNQGNGVSYGYYWCASFVNWCLRQARVSTSASAAAEISCQRWLKKCDQSGIYKGKEGYEPVEGDLIFFKDKGSKVPATHMGLVLYSDGESVFTVEGNTSNDNSFSSDGNYVAIKNYSLESDYIVGYATPDYSGNGREQKVDREPLGRSIGDYISTHKIEICNGDETVATVNEYELFSVEEITLDGFAIRYEKDGKTYTGIAELTDNAMQIRADNDGYKVLELLDSNGKKLINPLYLDPEKELRVPDFVPQKDGMIFITWEDGSGARLEAGDVIGGEKASLFAVWEVNVPEETWDSDDTMMLLGSVAPAITLIVAGVVMLILFRVKKRKNNS